MQSPHTHLSGWKHIQFLSGRKFNCIHGVGGAPFLITGFCKKSWGLLEIWKESLSLTFIVTVKILIVQPEQYILHQTSQSGISMTKQPVIRRSRDRNTTAPAGTCTLIGGVAGLQTAGTPSPGLPHLLAESTLVEGELEFPFPHWSACYQRPDSQESHSLAPRTQTACYYIMFLLLLLL